jgi:diacylglycerol kinase family enzyme
MRERLTADFFICRRAGSFTPLGYAVEERFKKKFKIFAYLYRVIKEYKIYNIKAKIDCGDKIHEGIYSLIMVLDSKRCFGFRFNRMYEPDDGLFHLLLIKSPGKDSFFNRIRMFFPFFRAFFLGFGKPYTSKSIVFTPIKSAEITLSKPTDFCVDGEKVTEKR